MRSTECILHYFIIMKKIKIYYIQFEGNIGYIVYISFNIIYILMIKYLCKTFF